MFKEIILFYFIYSFANPIIGVDVARKNSQPGKAGNDCGSYFVKQMFHLYSDEKIERKIRQVVQEFKKESKENKIVFTAGIPKSEKYSSKQIIKFTRVITNVGGGLNASDGVFYCPKPGLYSFFVNIMSSSNHAYAEIHKNDKFVVYVYTDHSGNSWKSGSNTVILQLDRGDRVSVKSQASNNFHLEATYFTGLKLCKYNKWGRWCPKNSQPGKAGNDCGSYFVKQMFHLFSDEKIERKIRQVVQEFKKESKENKIAFTAGLPKYDVYSSKQILKFTRVITNVGGGLNASDGVFYCPKPGLYSFFVNIMSSSNHAYAEIHKNDKFVAYVFTDHSGTNYKSGSNTVILQLERGDRVSVKAYASCNYHPNATYFTGLKI